MTAYTATQSGNWSDSATWGGSGVPGDGDTATIGAFTVTVDVNTTVGTSPNDATTKVVDKTSSTGALIIAAGVTFMVKGNRGLVNGATITQQAGSTVTFDNSGSGGSPVYSDINVGFTNYNFNGTAQSPCVFQSVSGSTWGLNSNWAALTATYTTFRRAVVTANNNSGNVSFTNCTFDKCDRLRINSNGTTNGCVINNCTFTSGTHATEDINLNYSSAYSSGTRTVYGNVLAKALTYLGKGFHIRGNYFGGGMSCVAGATVSSAPRNNVFRHDGGLNAGNGALFCFSTVRNYHIVENGAGNPHYVSATALLGADNTIAESIFEGATPDLIDTGDAIIVQGTACSGGNKVVGRNNIVLPASASGATATSGTLLTLYNAGAAVVTEWYRNTGNINDHAVAGKRGMFAVAEAGTGTAGQVAALKSNLAWGSSSSQGYIGERISGNVKDIITPGGCDYNWKYNTSAGDNGGGYNDFAAANDMWTAGNAAAAGVDANTGSSDPDFVDSSRNVAAWAVARGYGSTYSDGLTALQADPSRGEDLINYVFEGFKVQNTSMRSAAHDGGCVGAANFHKERSLKTFTTRKSAIETAFNVSF